MTEQDRRRLEQLHKDKVDRWSRQVKVYHDLLEYWISKERFIGASNKLNQSIEFISDRAANAAKELAHLCNINVS